MLAAHWQTPVQKVKLHSRYLVVHAISVILAMAASLCLRFSIPSPLAFWIALPRCWAMGIADMTPGRAACNTQLTRL